MKLGYEQAKIYQGFQSLASFVGSLFTKKKEAVKLPANFQEAELQLKALFG